MLYIILVFVFVFGITFGFLISKYLLGRQPKYVGTIVVIKDPDAPVNGKVIYSLELDDNPEIIESKKEVTFRVLIPDVESDRE
jgi:hypothetical protein